MASSATPQVSAAQVSASQVSAAQVNATPPGSASQVSATPPGSAAQVNGQQISASPFFPCPIVKVKPIGTVPKPSPMPTHDPGRPVIGGGGLDTKGLTVPSDAPSVPKKLTAKSWVVADLDTGAVLGACGPHEFGAPASVQKLLLAATVLPTLDPKRLVKVTAEDMNFEPGSSAVGLIKGGTYSVETLWLGLFLNSGNDAANVLARLGGGTEGVPGTLAAMNAEARHLGALDTHAETPSGLDGPGQVTSAYDLALIARVLFAREDFRRYIATMSTKIPAQPARDKHGFQIQNDNGLMYNYAGALGGKTGFTDIARHTYVGAAQRHGRRLVVTLLGAERRPLLGWQQGAALLNWGFSLPSDASVGHLVAPGEVDGTLAAAMPPSPAATGEAALRAGNGRTGQPMVLIGAAAIGSAFIVVWIAVMLVSQRRRAAYRRSVEANPTAYLSGNARGTGY